MLDLQTGNIRLEETVAAERDRLDLTTAKLKALEAFSSDLQGRYDRLQMAHNDKEQQLKELLSQDIAAKVVS